MAAEDLVLARRKALVAICERAANGVIDRVVAEASRAADKLGLDASGATRYGEAIRSVLPIASDALGLPDGPERDARIVALCGRIRAVSDQHNIPRIVERGLTAIAVRISREVVRRDAPEHGFSADELDREFGSFTGKMEARLFGD